ncbi:MAG: CRTAC1 family protein [Candidatus Poribacteria bacterium]|nr:CRTAC1 family protein [Candidatus Poribacteria bacterium]
MNFPTLRHLTFLTFFGWCLSLAHIQPAKADIPQPQVRFEFQPLPFQHTDGASGEKYFLEPLGSGVALFDYDNDNDLDLYFVNGNSLQSSDTNNSHRNRLFRNDDTDFVDITDLAGVGDTGYGLGCCVGDYNNDGFLDLYVANFGANVLYQNKGDGTFTDVARQAKVDGNQLSSSCAFSDYDNDGDLDLYTVNYVQFNLEENPKCTYQGVSTYCTPEALPGQSDSFFRNNGDGTFSDITQSAGLFAPTGKGLGVVWGDYDNDGDPDIFVANDTTPNFLYQNNGKGTFQNIALFAGVALSMEGRPYSGMGTNFGDFDNDGDLDIVVTNFQDQTNSLYQNEQNAFFNEVSFSTGIGEKSLPYLAWGVDFVDLNNDGWQDLFIANGHLDHNISDIDPIGTYAQRNQVFMNQKGRAFIDRSATMLKQKQVSRGSAFGDLDNDGDIDIVVSNLNDHPVILWNVTEHTSNWFILKLIGTSDNQSAIGTRVKIKIDQQIQVREVKSGSGYLSQSDLRLHFGLGQAKQIDQLEIHWPNGTTQQLNRVPGNQILTVTQEKRSG